MTELIHQDRGDDFVLVVEARLPQDVVRVLVDTAASTKADATLWLNSLRYEVRFQVFNQVELHVLNEYLFLFPEGASAPELGGGLQGEPEVAVGRRRPKTRLRRSEWQSVIHRDRGEPAQFSEETRSSRGIAFRVPPTQLALASLPFDPTVFPPQCGFRTCSVREWFSISLIGRNCVAPVHLVSRSVYCLLAVTSPGWRLISRSVILSASTTVDLVRVTLPQVEELRAVERRKITTRTLSSSIRVVMR